MDATGIAELNQRFGVAGKATLVEGQGGLAAVRVTLPVATGEIYLHGSHVTQWKAAGASEELLYLSSKARFAEGVAIRGGVPISFPWFADRKGRTDSPPHGFVRTKEWRLDGVWERGEGILVKMSTRSDEGTRAAWEGEFELEHWAMFGTELRQELVVRNTGKEKFVFEEALHAYYRVGDVRRTAIRGLGGISYIDKNDGWKVKPQAGEFALTEATDRIYLEARGPAELVDPELHRVVRVTKRNSRTTSVWNPWEAKAAGMSDVGTGEWSAFLCVEPNNVAEAGVELEAGEEHRMEMVSGVAGV